MGAAFSSAAVANAVRAAKICGQPSRLIIAPGAAAADDHDDEYDYWSALPDDLLFTIMARLDIQTLRRSGAVCVSWRHAHEPFHLPALEQAPCLLYGCDEYGPNDLALYCPTTDATFRVPFPGPPHDKRGFTSSCPGGWVFTTDEVGDPYLINPLTGVKAALPPVRTIYHNNTLYDDDGKNVRDADDPEDDIFWARHGVYLRVAISAAAEITECTVLIAHMPGERLSFARPGDKEWTLLSEKTRTVYDVLYNTNDGLFYVLYGRGSISALDLSGPSPSATTILPSVIDARKFSDMYLALGPSGQLLQVWRNWEYTDTPRMYPTTYKDLMKGACQGSVDFVGVDDNGKPSELYHAIAADQKIDVSQWLRERPDLSTRGLTEEVATNWLLVFKVDVEKKKLVELRDIEDHTLFLGRNSAVCLPTKDAPAFEPNCIYFTDDCFDYNPMLRNDLGIWNIKKKSMQKLGDAWPNLHPWLHLPHPIWIMPKF